MAEHRYGIKLKSAVPEAAVLKLLRKQFPDMSLGELREKIMTRDYIYLSDRDRYDGIKRMAKLLRQCDSAGLETEIFWEHRQDSASWQAESLSRGQFRNLLQSSRETDRQVSEDIDRETEGSAQE